MHRWVGLLAGLVLLVLAVTGGVLAFEEQVEHALFPALFNASRAGTPLPVDGAGGAGASGSSRAQPVIGLRMPEEPGDPLVVGLGNRSLGVPRSARRPRAGHSGRARALPPDHVPAPHAS